MLRIEDNERLTRVGPGTPMGALLRRYWHPVAATVELDDHPVKPVKVLGEFLMLFRDRQGRLGLIDDTCPHRRVSFLYGVPEQEGLRCCYHGWMFDRTGQCLEMPAEAPDSTFKDRVRIWDLVETARARRLSSGQAPYSRLQDTVEEAWARAPEIPAR
jgi:5,5'-dehydrodivanillate O-demethylase